MADWINLTMKFPGKCLECGKPIPRGQPGMWSRGVGVKHPECSESVPDATAAAASAGGPKIICVVCGKPAGCSECEFADICDISRVSPGCLCHACGQKKDVMNLYYTSVSAKHAAL